MARTRHVRTPDGTSLHVSLDGPDDAPLTVVFAHGWTLHHAGWEPYVRAVAADGAALPVRTVAYDQRGHGRSGRNEATPLSVDLLGEDLRGVLDECAPEGPVVLVGHSMGGMTIMALAALHPELFRQEEAGEGAAPRVVGVLLTGTSAGFSDPPERRGDRMIRRGLGAFLAYGAKHPARIERIRPLVPPSSWIHLRRVRTFLFGERPPRQAVLECAQMIHNTPIDVIAAFFPVLLAHEKTEALAALSGTPVRVLCGTRDRLTPVSHTRTIGARLPDAVLHIEPGCGHMLHTERPAVVLDHLRALVASVHPAAPAP